VARVACVGAQIRLAATAEAQLMSLIRGQVASTQGTGGR